MRTTTLQLVDRVAPEARSCIRKALPGIGLVQVVHVTGPDGQEANAKSVMGVLLLCGSIGTMINVRARGQRAREAVDAIGVLIAARFGESE